MQIGDVLDKTIQSVNESCDSTLEITTHGTVPDLRLASIQNLPLDVYDSDDTPYQPRTSQPEINPMEEVWVLGDVAAVRAVFRSEWNGKPADDRIKTFSLVLSRPPSSMLTFRVAMNWVPSFQICARF